MIPQGLALYAPWCGSWGAPNRGTSMRSYINPHGHEAFPSVSVSNSCVSRKLGCRQTILNLTQLGLQGRDFNHRHIRLVLLLMLNLALNHFYLVEQPTQSLLHMHRRWQLFENRISYDTRAASRELRSNPSTDPSLCPGVHRPLLDAVARRYLAQAHRHGWKHAKHRDA